MISSSKASRNCWPNPTPEAPHPVILSQKFGFDSSSLGGGEYCGRREYISVVLEMLSMPSMTKRFQPRPAPVSTSMSSRSSGHRAQLGGARPAREAALRKRLPSPLEKRCFSSASQTGQLAFWHTVHAIHGAALLASTGPGLAIHGKAFRLSKAALLIGCADQPSPIHGAALLASTGPGLDIHVEPFVRPPGTARWRSARARSCASQTLALAPRKAVLFVCFADRASPCLACRCKWLCSGGPAQT